MTPDQARALFAACETEHLGPMIRLGLLVGMRPGELAGLRWSDVDFDRRLLTVGHAVEMRGGRGHHVDVLKTRRPTARSAFRPLPLTSYASSTAKGATEDRGDGALERTVFPSRRDTVLEPSNVRRELSRICAAAGVPRITPNELRHTSATLLNDGGVPLELIADVLGHTTTTMLQRHYRHRVRPSADAAVGTMDELFDGRDGQPASADSRERMKSASASAETSRREPSRNDRNSPDRRKR